MKIYLYKLTLPELIQYAWENNIKDKIFTSENGIYQVDFNERGEFSNYPTERFHIPKETRFAVSSLDKYDFSWKSSYQELYTTQNQSMKENIKKNQNKGLYEPLFTIHGDLKIYL